MLISFSPALARTTMWTNFYLTCTATFHFQNEQAGKKKHESNERQAITEKKTSWPKPTGKNDRQKIAKKDKRRGYTPPPHRLNAEIVAEMNLKSCCFKCVHTYFAATNRPHSAKTMALPDEKNWIAEEREVREKSSKKMNKKHITPHMAPQSLQTLYPAQIFIRLKQQPWRLFYGVSKPCAA